MNEIVLDEAALNQLGSPEQPVQVCDQSGRVRGYYAPVAPRSLYRQVQSPYTYEELKRAAEEPGGRPLADILADLEKRG